MINEFTKIVDKNFIIGYVLPVIIYATIFLLILDLYFPQTSNIVSKFLSQNESSILISKEGNYYEGLGLVQNLWTISIIIIISWLISIFLMLLNRGLIRFLEGYHYLETPLGKFMIKLQKRKYNRLRKKTEQLKEEYFRYKNAGEMPPAQLTKKYGNILSNFVSRYPDSKYIMPTSLGNIIKASERYPRKIYGIDSILFWSRIMLIVPKDSKDMLNSAKAQLDFAINSLYFTAIIIVEYFALSLITNTYLHVWIPVLALILFKIFYRYTLTSALEWCECIKSIYDIYRKNLLTQMGIKIPASWLGERQLWEKLNKTLRFQYPLDVLREDQPYMLQ